MKNALHRTGFLLGVLLLLSLTGWAQEDVPACKPGKLVPDYEKKECTVGNLDFEFGEIKSTDAKITQVTPVEGGLKFDIPLPKAEESGPPQAIIIVLAIPFRVKGIKTAIVDARLAGNFPALPKGAFATTKMIIGDPEKPREQVKLRLAAFSSVKATFSQPLKAGTFIPVMNDFDVHSGKPPGDEADQAAPPLTIFFADTFTSSAKDAEPESEPEP